MINGEFSLKILSINLGERQSLKIGNKDVETGIFKKPVATAVITKDGLANDVIGDIDRHGGADQAVYLYSAQDYAWWESELGREVLCLVGKRTRP